MKHKRKRKPKAKPHNAEERKLEKQVTRVSRALNTLKRGELKYNNVSDNNINVLPYSATYATVFGSVGGLAGSLMQDILDIPQGNTNNSREGQSISVKSYGLRYKIFRTDNNVGTHVRARVIAFQLHTPPGNPGEINGNFLPSWSDILAMTGDLSSTNAVEAELVSPVNPFRRNNVKIIHDKVHQLDSYYDGSTAVAPFRVAGGNKHIYASPMIWYYPKGPRAVVNYNNGSTAPVSYECEQCNNIYVVAFHDEFAPGFVAGSLVINCYQYLEYYG